MIEDRRSSLRIVGPFEAMRTGGQRLELSNLSEGGCFVNSFEKPIPGRRWTLRIELPIEGWIAVTAETLYTRTGYGYGVKFVDINPEDRARLTRCLDELGEEPLELA